MSAQTGVNITEIINSGKITSQDVILCRRTMFGDGHISDDEAQSILTLNTNVDEICAEWADFYVEAITDYLVHQTQPRGYISQENANWLINNMLKDGKVDHQTELELLISLVENALTVPPVLSSMVISEVQYAVLKGEGPMRRNLSLEPGAIGAAEVDLLRRALYAAGGDGHVSITQEEANSLFELNDATIEAKNDPAWSDLFVKAIASYLMAFSGYKAASREDALRRENWVEDTSSSLGGMMGDMVADGFSNMLVSGLRSVWSDLQGKAGIEASYEQKLSSDDGLTSKAEKISEDEARWLAERIGRDGVLHENEKALLRFIKEESPVIHDTLNPLLRKIA